MTTSIDGIIMLQMGRSGQTHGMHMAYSILSRFYPVFIPLQSCLVLSYYPFIFSGQGKTCTTELLPAAAHIPCTKQETKQLVGVMPSGLASNSSFWVGEMRYFVQLRNLSLVMLTESTSMKIGGDYIISRRQNTIAIQTQ